MEKKIYPEDIVFEEFMLECIKGPNGKIYDKRRKDNAIYENCTHTKCNTCGINDARYKNGNCESCDSKKSWERYLALPVTNQFPICLESGDEYFFDESDLEDYLENNELKESDLFLYEAEQRPFSELTSEYWSDESNEDGEVPAALEKLISEFNKKLSEIPGLYWCNEKVRYSSTSA